MINPEVVNEVIDAYVTDMDARVCETLQRVAGWSQEMAADRQALWSIESRCLLSGDLCNMLQEAGIDASLVMNEQAYSWSTTERSGRFGDTRWRDHCFVRVNAEDGALFIDPYWQQFLCLVALSQREVHDNFSASLMPAERVLCYEAGDVESVAAWFALVVRTMHDKIATGVLRGKVDTFSRPLPSTFEILLQKDARGAADYSSIRDLEAMATRIWHPMYLREIDSVELLVDRG